MIEIFVHRAIFENKENSLEGIEFWLKSGFNIEIDVRKNKQEIYLSHDKQKNGDLFRDACKIIKQNSKKVAIHIKENFDMRCVTDLIYEFDIGKKCFIFSTLQNYDKIKKMENISYASYQNNVQNIGNSNIIWCDESNEIWYDKKIFSKYKKNQKTIIVMSKELLKNSNLMEIHNEWKRLINLEVDGICTDYPFDLMRYRDENII